MAFVKTRLSVDEVITRVVKLGKRVEASNGYFERGTEVIITSVEECFGQPKVYHFIDKDGIEGSCLEDGFEENIFDALSTFKETFE